MIVVDSHSDLAETTNGEIGEENESLSVPGKIPNPDRVLCEDDDLQSPGLAP